MQIQLKQTEIIAAIKQYVTTQGINLGSKSVEITFSATRGAAGIIADVVIEEIQIPGFTDSEVEEAVKASEGPALALVKPEPVAVAKAAIATEVTVEPMAEAQAEEHPMAEAAAAKTTSLFN